MIKEAIHKLTLSQDLDINTTAESMREIMSGNADNAQIAAFITALRMKGETIDEITACAKVMREAGVKLKHDKAVFEIVGTGGDEVGTFNISTTASFVIAAAGISVAKHGNRSVSSKSGAADILESLGANIKTSPKQCEDILNKCNICFMFAQIYHPAMKYAAPVRREIGIRTVFNILGPLTNPASAEMQLMGVYNDALVEPLAHVLQNLGVKNGMVICGNSQLDEAVTTGNNLVCEIKNGEISKYILDPQEYGFKKSEIKDLVGGTADDNAKITKDIFSGKLRGAKYDTVVLNSALGLYIAGKADSIKSAITLANDIIDSGKALAKLKQFVSVSNAV